MVSAEEYDKLSPEEREAKDKEARALEAAQQAGQITVHDTKLGLIQR